MSEKATRPCPFCSEQIKSIAIRCKHCGSMIVDPPSKNNNRGSNPYGGRELRTPCTGESSKRARESAEKSESSDFMMVKKAFAHRYDIQYEVGRGGMASVYKAIEKSSKRVVALKVVHKNLSYDTEFLARFHREAQLCAKLDHKNIVRVHDAGQISGMHFIEMEFLEGIDLNRLLRKNGSLNAGQTLQYLLPVAEALDYAHSKGYIHRDIKCANIFITGNGTSTGFGSAQPRSLSGTRVVLMDFGIAHASAGQQLTTAGTVIGTPEYMSPEQAEGKKVDHRTDIYSLGVVMYECLTGMVPFKGENMISTIFKVVHSEPDQKPLHNAATAIKNMVLSLLKKDPGKRPRDAMAVANIIRRMLQGKVSNDGIEQKISGSYFKDTIRDSQQHNQKKMFSGSTYNSGRANRELSPLVATLLIIMLALIIIIVTQLFSM